MSRHDKTGGPAPTAKQTAGPGNGHPKGAVDVHGSTDSAPLAKLEWAARALAEAKTLEDVKALSDIAAAARHYARAARLGLQAQNDAAEVKLRAERMAGEILAQLPSAQGQRTDLTSSQPEGKSRAARLQALGVSEPTAWRWQQVASVPDGDFEAHVAKTRGDGKELTSTSVLRLARRRKVGEKLAAIDARAAEPLTGSYDVIVIDPPWPMQKIERDVRPNQVALDYPTMTEAELEGLSIPAAHDCHVWLWTTHRFLPMAHRLLAGWGLRYVCTFVWHKPGGFQPVGLPQYNCEFALYARRGSPAFVTTKAFPVCFDAPRGTHSEKPEAFYDLVRRVTAGHRLDMFNRRSIEGFDGWGKEAA